MFEPLLSQGIVLQSHQEAYDTLNTQLIPVGRQETGRTVLLSGLAGTGKSRLVQYYLYTQGQSLETSRHHSVAWLNGHDSKTFQAQWHALAEQLKETDTALQAMDDTIAIAHWFEQKLSSWLLVIDNADELLTSELLDCLPSKGGHVVITTRHPNYLDTKDCPLQTIPLHPLSTPDAKRLIETHFGGKHWKAMGHAEETEALDELIHYIGRIPQGLVQAALHMRKKGISLARYVSQFKASPELRWLLLKDTVLGQFQEQHTMAYLWGASKNALLRILEQNHPDIPHAKILPLWLTHLAKSFLGSTENILKVLSISVLEQQWHVFLVQHFPTLTAQTDVLWLNYQQLLPQYLPISTHPVERTWQITPTVQSLLAHNFPRTQSEELLVTTVSQDTPPTEHETQQKRTIVPVIYEASLGANAQVHRLHSEILANGLENFTAWHLPRENPDFIPRPYATDKLADKLAVVTKKGQASRQLVLTAAVSGMGGVGKTELARHYIHHTDKLGKHYQRRFWLDASTETQLSLAFRELGEALYLIESKASDEEVKKTVHRWLGINPGWLLVFDNADNYNAIKSWIPQKGGTVLVTTRESHPGRLPPEQIVRVEPLETEEAVNWLYQLSKRKASTLSQGEQAAAQELMVALECLPLAIAQVAAYLQAHPNETIAEYLKVFQDSPIILMESGEAGVSSTEASIRQVIARTWGISLQAIEKQLQQWGRPNQAQALLNALSYLASKDIPLAPLESWFKAYLSQSHAHSQLNAYWLDDYLALLYQYSLIQRAGDSLQVHRLVQGVMRYHHQHPQPEATPPLGPKFDIEYLVKLLQRFVRDIEAGQGQGDAVLSFARDRRLMPHVAQLLEHWKKDALHPDRPEIASSLGIVGTAHHAQGNFVKGLDFLEQALWMRQTLHEGKPHPDVARSLNNVGMAYKAKGEPAKGLKYLEQALQMRQTLHEGKGHPDVAESLNNVGLLHGILGDLTKRLCFQMKALLMQKDLHGGTPHSDVALSLNNVGECYMVLNRMPEALLLLNKAVLMYKALYRNLPHLGMATVLQNLGSVYFYQEQFQKAAKHIEKAMGMMGKILGLDHPSTKQCKHSYDLVATSLERSGKIQIEKNHRSALEAQRWRQALEDDEALRSIHGKRLRDLTPEQLKKYVFSDGNKQARQPDTTQEDIQRNYTLAMEQSQRSQQTDTPQAIIDSDEENPEGLSLDWGDGQTEISSGDEEESMRSTHEREQVSAQAMIARRGLAVESGAPSVPFSDATEARDGLTVVAEGYRLA